MERLENLKGKIITFYSFKGGVGRSMALANVATLLSKWGKKVLIVDFDLEAPGIENYFKENVLQYNKQGIEISLNKIDIDFKFSRNRADCNGLIDILKDITNDDNKLNWRDCVMSVQSEKHNVYLDIIPAGKEDANYTTNLQTIDWDFLFEEKDFSDRLETLRKEWKEEYDFVFIDSRTGISDIGGICTIYLPDIIAFLFTTTQASLLGCTDVIRRAKAARKKLPYERSVFITIPIPSRDVTIYERDKAFEWRPVFDNELAEFYNDWLPIDTPIRTAIETFIVPFVPYWSFGDRLPVIEEGTSENSIGNSYEKIGLLILGNFDWKKVKTGFTTSDFENSKKISIQQERTKIQFEVEERLKEKIEYEKQYLIAKSKRTRTKALLTALASVIIIFTVLYFSYYPFKETKFLQQVELYPSIVEQFESQSWQIDSIRTLKIDVNNFPFLKDKFGLFKNLDTLIFSGLKFNDFNDFNSVENIKRLDISSCRFNNFIGIEKFKTLQSLLITNNYSIKDLKGIEKLSTLNSLIISNNSSLDRLNGIDGLNALEKLTIQGNENLSSLNGIEELSSIKSLSILGAYKFKNLAVIGKLNTLQALKITSISDVFYSDTYRDPYRDSTLSISEIDFNKLSKLNSLEITGNYKLNDFLFIADLQKLDTLKISNNNTVNSIRRIGVVKHLKSLTLANLGNLNNLQGIEVLKSLSFLNISNPYYYRSDKTLSRYSGKSISLDSLSKLNNLKTLIILGNYNVTDIKVISTISSLQSLTIYNNANLKSLVGIDSLLNLQSLNVSYCNSLSSLNGIEQLKHLKTLTLLNNGKLRDVVPIKNISSLEALSIISLNDRFSDTETFKPIQITFSDWKGLNKLRTLEVTGNFVLYNLQGIDLLSSLDTLIISNNILLTNLEGLQNNVSVKHLTLTSNDSLKTLNDIEKLKFLESLTIAENYNLVNLHGIEKLASLKSLAISNNFNLENTEGIESITSLEFLTIDNQQKIKFSDSTFSKLLKLKIFTFSGDMEIDYKKLKKNISNLKLIRISDE